MILYIVRHGQSLRNLQRSGSFDCELTATGEKQADAAGAWLMEKGIQHIYCSPSIRTLQTATIISKRIGIRPRAWTELVEWGYLFDCPGLTGKAMRAAYPGIDIDATFADDVCWIAHKSTEAWDELRSRVQRVLDQLLQWHPLESPPVLFVTHAHFARHLVSTALGIMEPDGLGGVVQHYNCGITCLEFTSDSRILWFANEHAYLGDLATQ